MIGVCQSCEQVENIVNEQWQTCEACENEYQIMSAELDEIDRQALESHDQNSDEFIEYCINKRDQRG